MKPPHRVVRRFVSLWEVTLRAIIGQHLATGPRAHDVNAVIVEYLQRRTEALDAATLRHDAAESLRERLGDNERRPHGTCLYLLKNGEERSRASGVRLRSHVEQSTLFALARQ